MLDLHRLRLLRELKHRGTLTAVAEALSYSPSSISQQLAVLEKEVGVPLLEPVGRRVRLTEQAEILVVHTEAVLEQLERAEAELAASMAGLTGVIRIATFQTAAMALIPTALTLLREAHPGLRVQVTQTEPETALPALLARDFDLVMAEEYPGNPSPRYEEIELAGLCEDEIRLAVPKAGAMADSLEGTEALAALAERPWVMEPMGTEPRQWATTLCRTAGFEPDVRFESSDLLLHARLVEEGHAVALLPDLVWSRRAADGVVLRSLPSGQRRRRLTTAVRRGGGQHPAIRACRDALRRTVAANSLARPLAGDSNP
ncbi:LysR substrate-binding domain-containing protein [Actinomadura rudentiformis]|uniref:LysR family transcriptional regulator n=1 Tax=Actinomadura rudentiformis TaxID=359158 RepID=A0A6H9YP92_9ACTN|nr:LysR substrate-binding domain-containing protein [Actinomadura rudentiformis]KAB2340843.1 LysR family transcriptional regulator [Actinomadura rudentiformis]